MSDSSNWQLCKSLQKKGRSLDIITDFGFLFSKILNAANQGAQIRKMSAISTETSLISRRL